MFTLAATGANLCMTSLCLRNVGRYSRQSLARHPSAGTTDDCRRQPRGILSTLGSWHGFLTKKIYPKHLQQSEQLEERGRRLKGEEWGGVVVGGMGRCGGGVGWGGQRCGGGKQQKYVCAANLTRTFERLNPKESAAASACRTTNSQSWDRLGFFTGGAPQERRKNNYNDNLRMLYLTNAADGKYLHCKKV